MTPVIAKVEWIASLPFLSDQPIEVMLSCGCKFPMPDKKDVAIHGTYFSAPCKHDKRLVVEMEDADAE